MLKIRLQRVGRKHEPSFRVVLTDSKNSTKSGKFLEVLGSYDPRKNTEQFNVEKIKHWISKGAKPTDTLHNIFVDQKIVEGKKVNVLPKKSPIIKEKGAVTENSSAEPEMKQEKEVTETSLENSGQENSATGEGQSVAGQNTKGDQNIEEITENSEGKETIEEQEKHEVSEENLEPQADK